jgi:hypothetical protein
MICLHGTDIDNEWCADCQPEQEDDRDYDYEDDEDNY